MNWIQFQTDLTNYLNAKLLKNFREQGVLVLQLYQAHVHFLKKISGKIEVFLCIFFDLSTEIKLFAFCSPIL